MKMKIRRTREEMQEWWEDTRKISRNRNYVTITSISRCFPSCSVFASLLVGTRTSAWI